MSTSKTKMPNISLPKTNLKMPNISLPKTNLKMPNISLPKTNLKIPNLNKMIDDRRQQQLTDKLSKVGFSENLKKDSMNKLTNIDKNICSSILNTGKNMNKKYFFNNEFSNLTKKGGRRRKIKTRRRIRYRLI